MKVKKELYLPAPYQGVAVYAQGQCYTSNAGLELIENIRYESACRDVPGPHILFPSKEIYSRISEDNGKNWKIQGDIYREDPVDMEGLHYFVPSYYRDPDNGFLISLYLTRRINPDKLKEDFSDEGINNIYQQMFYQISRDKGRTWSKEKVLVHKGNEYDEVHWGPGLYYGKNGGIAGGGSFKLSDGTVIAPLFVNLEDGKRNQSGLLLGRWKEDLSDIEWEFSDYITVPLNKTSQGCVEPMPALLDNDRIFISLRCCGDRENKTFPSLKFWVISEDGGRTFSEPQPLTYEDGSMVWSPSSYAGILRSSVNKRYYWFGNILDKPTYSSAPRYPLCIAELIPEKGVLIKDSVTVIDTKPEDFPEENKRRYTNFGFYEDRETKEIILTLPEQPKVDWKDFTSDCYRYRISI